MIEYACSRCGVQGVKLWREFERIFAERIELMCVDCAQKHEGTNYVDWREDGTHMTGYGFRTDTIGGLVPAVPTIEGDTFWGYTSVPKDRVKWWIELPLRARSES